MEPRGKALPEKAKRLSCQPITRGFAMLTLFQRKRLLPAIDATPIPLAVPPKGLSRPESAASLLAMPRRQRLLEHIWQRTSLSSKQFASLYRAPLDSYAELLQLFPSSESHTRTIVGWGQKV